MHRPEMLRNAAKGEQPLRARDATQADEAQPGRSAALAAAVDPAAGRGETVWSQHAQHLRMLEALLFAASEPLDARTVARHYDASVDVAALLVELQSAYRYRGVNLVRVAGKWMFRTASDLACILQEQRETPKRLSRAAMETLAIIAYHQPVTRAEIEAIRGVVISKGTLDVLLETGWVRWRGRRRAPGRPLTYDTSDGFLTHFGLASIADLPGLADLKVAGLLDGAIPADFKLPDPAILASLAADELPLEDETEVEHRAGDGEEE